MKISSGEYDETHLISEMTRTQSERESDETSRLRKKSKLAHKVRSKAYAQALWLEHLLLSPSTLRIEIFDKYCLFMKLQDVPRLVQMSQFQSLKLKTSNEEPSSFSSSGKEEPTLIFRLALIRMQNLETLNWSKRSPRQK